MNTKRDDEYTSRIYLTMNKEQRLYFNMSVETAKMEALSNHYGFGMVPGFLIGALVATIASMVSS
jgi:hypothetical protein